MQISGTKTLTSLMALAAFFQSAFVILEISNVVYWMLKLPNSSGQHGYSSWAFVAFGILSAACATFAAWLALKARDISRRWFAVACYSAAKLIVFGAAFYLLLVTPQFYIRIA